MEPIAINPDRELIVKLPARQWNIVTYALNKHPMPFETVAPVISGISDQLRAQATTLTTEEMQAHVDGEEQHADASRMPERSESVPNTSARHVDGDGNRVAPDP